MNKFCRIPAVLYILHKLVLKNFQNFEKIFIKNRKNIAKRLQYCYNNKVQTA